MKYLIQEAVCCGVGIGKQLLIALPDKHCLDGSKETGLVSKVRRVYYTSE